MTTSSKKLEAVVNGTLLTFDSAVPFTTVTLNTSQWYHVAAVYDGTNSLLKLYLNGNNGSFPNPFLALFRQIHHYLQ
jgi:hypothetical protein